MSLLGVLVLAGLLFVFSGDTTPARAVNGGGTIVTGSATYSSHVRRFNSAGAAIDGGGFFAFNHLNLQGLSVATGDVNGDGQQDLVVGDGVNHDTNNIASAGNVRVLSPTGTELTHLAPFGTGFGGAINVAASDLDGDGKDEVIVGAGPGGGPNVKVFKWNGTGLSEIASWFAYDAAFHGGVFVAGGDGEVITGPGPGGGPHVKLWSPNDQGVITLDNQFFAYDGKFAGGVHVGTGDFNNDGLDDIVTGPGPGGGPNVKVFEFEGPQRASFFAYDAGFTGGVYVAGLGVPGVAGDQIVTGPGSGGGPHVKIFNQSGGNPVASFFAYDAKFLGGVMVAGVRNPGADSPEPPGSSTTSSLPSTTTSHPTTTTTGSTTTTSTTAPG
ncbi:MAG: VCBS repeat-containing protein [Actinobacteria bacterium]|nr:VCBS repeat-containing protein [Actinomycetota bacterium]